MKALTLSLALSLVLASCGKTTKSNSTNEPVPETSHTAQEEAQPAFTNKGHELIYNMTQKVGDYNQLRSKNDVVYTYTYQTPDGKTDIVTEKYIFDGELSYGKYVQHERTLPEYEGILEQGYDGTEYWMKHNGELVTDAKLLKAVKFNRPTNFYWFTMMQKLMDDGVIYEHIGEQTIANKNYDVVKISFESDDTVATDIYQVYINKETQLIDQFLFTVADFGVIDTPFLMTLAYENIDGILLPTQRAYKKSDWNAIVTDQPAIKVTWSDITFNTNLSTDVFKK